MEVMDEESGVDEGQSGDRATRYCVVRGFGRYRGNDMVFGVTSKVPDCCKVTMNMVIVRYKSQDVSLADENWGCSVTIPLYNKHDKFERRKHRYTTIKRRSA